MRRNTVGTVLLLILMVTVAGCAGNSAAPETATPTQTPTEAPTQSAGPTDQSEPIPTTQPVPPERDNPWNSETLIVNISTAPNDSRNYTPIVLDAIEYWNADGTQYTPYDVNLELYSDAKSADVTVDFTSEQVPILNETNYDILGTSPVVKPHHRVSSADSIYVKTGYNNTSTLHILQHEFGHYLGLEHGEEPMPLMSEFTDATHLPMPNATERGYGWKSTNITVYVSIHGMVESPVESQIQHALDYYESGAEGWMESDVHFERVNNRSKADIAIDIYRYEVNSEDLNRDGSIGMRYGKDLDDDQPLEYFTSSRIIVAGVRDDAVGWHTGSWLAYVLGGEDYDDVPEPFQDADHDERRGDWWE